MIFAHISDLHLAKRVNGYSMLEDQQHILSEIMDILTLNAAEALLIAGDIYDKAQPPAEAVRMFDDFIYNLHDREIKVFAISGNHDSADRIAYGARLFENNGVYVSPAFDGSIKSVLLSDDYGPIKVYLIPYLRPSEVKRFFPDCEINGSEAAVKTVIDNENIDRSIRNIAVSHQFVTGAATCESEEMTIGGQENISAEVFNMFDYTALGHIHGPQNIIENKIRYSGTPLKYSFSEANHKKSVTIVDIGKKGEVKTKTCPLTPLRDMRVLKGGFEELSKGFSEDYIHVILTEKTPIPDAFRRLMLYYPNIMKLTYENIQSASFFNMGDMAKKRGDYELVNDFFYEMNGKKMSEKQSDYIKKTLTELRDKK